MSLGSTRGEEDTMHKINSLTREFKMTKELALKMYKKGVAKQPSFCVTYTEPVDPCRFTGCFV